MLVKLEIFTEFQPSKPLSHKIEQFLRQYKVTDFACNSFQDTLLLKAGIKEGITPLTMEFYKPDYKRMGLRLESNSLEKVEQFVKFFQQYDSSTTLELIKNNTYSIQMDCATCLEKVTPIFEQAFIERIQADPESLRLYQQESEQAHAQCVEHKLAAIKDQAPISLLTAVAEKRDAFFANSSLKTSKSPITSNNKTDCAYYFQPK